MLERLVDVLLSPIALTALAARVLTVLLRHRIYIYGRCVVEAHPGSPLTEVRSSSKKEDLCKHVFVIQNMEDNDLTVPFQLQISTTRSAGRFLSPPRLIAGREAAIWRQFTPDGVQRWVLLCEGMSALETWKLVNRPGFAGELLT